MDLKRKRSVIPLSSLQGRGEERVWMSQRRRWSGRKRGGGRDGPLNTMRGHLNLCAREGGQHVEFWSGVRLIVPERRKGNEGYSDGTHHGEGKKKDYQNIGAD